MYQEILCSLILWWPYSIMMQTSLSESFKLLSGLFHISYIEILNCFEFSFRWYMLIYLQKWEKVCDMLLLTSSYYPYRILILSFFIVKWFQFFSTTRDKTIILCFIRKNAIHECAWAISLMRESKSMPSSFKIWITSCNVDLDFWLADKPHIFNAK